MNCENKIKIIPYQDKLPPMTNNDINYIYNKDNFPTLLETVSNLRLRCTIYTLDGKELEYTACLSKGLDLRIYMRYYISEMWGINIEAIYLIEIPTENQNHTKYQCIIINEDDNKQLIYSYADNHYFEINEEEWEEWNNILYNEYNTNDDMYNDDMYNDDMYNDDMYNDDMNYDNFWGIDPDYDNI